MECRLFSKELVVCSWFWRSKLDAEFCMATVFSVKDFLGPQSQQVIKHMLYHELCAECIKMSGVTPIQYLKTEIGIPRYNLLLVLSLARELAEFQESVKHWPPSSARTRWLACFCKFVFQQLDLERWTCTQLVRKWITSLEDGVDNEEATRLLSERLRLIGLAASLNADPLYVPRVCPDVWHVVKDWTHDHFVDKVTQTYICRESSAENENIFGDSEECLDGELLSTSRVSIKQSPASRANFEHPHGQPPEQGVSPRQPPAQGVSTRQPPAQGVSTSQPPAQGVSTRQPPAQGVSTRQPPAQNVSTRQPPAQGVSTRQPHAQGVSTRQPPGQNATNKQQHAGNAERFMKKAVLSRLTATLLKTGDHCLQRGLMDVHCFAKCSGRGPGVSFSRIIDYFFRAQFKQELRSKVVMVDKEDKREKSLDDSNNSSGRRFRSHTSSDVGGRLRGGATPEIPKQPLVPLSPPPVASKPGWSTSVRGKSTKLRKSPQNTTTIVRETSKRLVTRRVSQRKAAASDKQTGIVKKTANNALMDADSQSSDSDIFVSPVSSFSSFSAEVRDEQNRKLVTKRRKLSPPAKPANKPSLKSSKAVAPLKKKQKTSQTEPNIFESDNENMGTTLTDNKKGRAVMSSRQKGKFKWTLEEDRRLYVAISCYLKDHKPIDFAVVSSAFPFRSADSLKNRWAIIRTSRYYLQRKIRDYLRSKDGEASLNVSTSPRNQPVRHDRGKRSRKVPFSPPPVVSKRGKSTKLSKSPRNTTAFVRETSKRLVTRRVSQRKAAASDKQTGIVKKTANSAVMVADSFTEQPDSQSSDSDIFVSPVSSFSSFSPGERDKQNGKLITKRRKLSPPAKPANKPSLKSSKTVAPLKKKQKTSQMEPNNFESDDESMSTTLTDNNKGRTVMSSRQKGKSKWTLEEDRRLYVAISCYLKNHKPIDFAVVSSAFPSRSADSLKNRWAIIRTSRYYLQRKIRDYLRSKDGDASLNISTSPRNQSVRRDGGGRQTT